MIGGKSRKVGKVYGVVPEVVGKSKNLLKQRQFGSLVHNGISFAQQADGGIRVSGTASANAFCNLSFIADATTVTFSYPVGTMTASITEKNAALAIIAQPENATVVEGGTAVFTVAATGEGLSYQWKYRYSESAPWTDSGKEGAKTDSLRFVAEDYHNGYEYCCVITDANGRSITSDPATLTVKEEADAIKIIQQPKNCTTPVGSVAVFTVVAEGDDLSYQWEHKTPTGTKWITTTAGTGTTTNELSIEALAYRDGYIYHCVIIDANGNSVTSESAKLTIGEEKTLVLAFGGWDENGATVSKGTVSGGRSLTFEGNGELARIYLMVYSGAAVDTVVYPQLELGSEATDYVPYGELIQSLTRKIKKSYDVVGGRTKQFYSAEFLSYDGEYEVLQVEYEGKICDLYRLKKSGILTLNDNALFWMCSGGEKGVNGSYSNAEDAEKAYGGRGGYGGSLTSGQIASGSNWVVSIGAGGSYTGDGASSITDGTTTYKTGARPACGYGPGGSTVNWSTAPSGGAGSGESTYPFGLTSLKAHCPGGGGGGAAIYVYNSSQASYVTRHQGGGKGGSNGGNGIGVEGMGSTSWSGSAPGGSGGAYGGGKGGGVSHDNHDFTYTNASAAYYYGGGGGGGSAGGSRATWKYTPGANGYQGVVYILDYKGGVAV